MRKVLYFTGTFLAVIPAFAIFSEGEIWVNFAAMAYILLLSALSRTRKGKRLIINVMKIL